MTTRALDAPFMFAIAALDLCGAQIDQIPGDAGRSLSDGDFRLSFDLTPAMVLQVDHESDSQTYRVRVLLTVLPERAAAIERLALQLNFLHEGARHYAIDGATQALVLTERVPLAPELDVEAFAVAIAELIEAVHALQHYQDSLATAVSPTELLQAQALRA